MPKRGSQARHAAAKSPHSAAADSPASNDWPRLIWLAGTALYVGLFLATRLPSVEAVTGETWRRWQFAALLVQPDALWESWTGGPGAWGVADRLPIVGLAAVILVVAAAAGDLLLRALRVATFLTWAERAFFASAAGLNLLSLWTLGIGLAGGLAERAWWIVPGTGAVVAWLAWCALDVRHKRASHAALRDKPAVALKPGFESFSRLSVGATENRFATRFFIVLAVPLAVAIVLGGMLPPVEFDVREYHLQAPKEFFERGRVEFLPHNVYGNMPLGVEMHALAAMCVSRDWWWGALVGKAISAAFAPLTALGLFAAGRRLFSSTAGALAALVYLSIPWVAQGATLGLVEAGTGCYLLATLVAASRLSVHEKSATEPHRAGWTLLTGFLAGGAMATKYPAAAFVVLPIGAWVAWTSWRQQRIHGRSNRSAAVAAHTHSALLDKPAVSPPMHRARDTAFALTLFAIAVAAGGGLWLAKNWALAGNPVYPLAYDWFDGWFEGATRTAELNAQWQQAHRPPNFEPADFWRRLAGFVLTSEWLSPLVWPLAALGLVLGWRDGRVKWWLGYVALCFALWWLLTHRIDRFWVPVLPIVALLAGGAVNSATTTPWRRGLMALVGVGVLWNFVVITSGIGGGDNRYFESLDRLKLDPSRLAPWHAWLNTHTPAGQSVLSVGDAQVFDLEVPVLYNTVFDPSIFESVVRDEHGALRKPAEIRERLRGVAFVYVNWSEIVRYRSPGNYGFSSFVEPAIFKRLVAEGVLAPPVPEFADVPMQIFPVRP